MAVRYTCLWFIILFDFAICHPHGIESSQVVTLPEVTIDCHPPSDCAPSKVIILPIYTGTSAKCSKSGEGDDLNPIRKFRAIPDDKILYSRQKKNEAEDDDLGNSVDFNFRRNLIAPPKKSQISDKIQKKLENFIDSVANRELEDITPEVYSFILSYRDLPEFVSKLLKKSKQRTGKSIDPKTVLFLFNLATQKITDKNKETIIKKIEETLGTNHTRKQAFSNVVIHEVLTWAQDNHFFDFHQRLATILVNFIFGIVNRQLIPVPPNELDLILNFPGLLQFIDSMFVTYNLPYVLTPPEVVMLLNLMRSWYYKEPIPDLPPTVIYFVISLEGGADLTFYLLSQMYLNDQAYMMAFFTQFLQQTPTLKVPDNLYSWLQTPNGNILTDYLIKEGQMTCHKNELGPVYCVKTPQNTYTRDIKLNTSNADEAIELQAFILGVINKKFPELSLEFIRFISQQTDDELKVFVEKAFKDLNISQSTINPEEIILLLNIIKERRELKPITYVPVELMKLLFSLDESEEMMDLADYILNSLFDSSKIDILEFLKDVFASMGGNIPPLVIQLIRFIPFGDQILEYLNNPELFSCQHNLQDKSISCTDLSVEIEIKQFITDIKNNQINFPSAKLLLFIMNQQNLDTYIESIYDKYSIPQSDVDPSTIYIILKIMIDMNESKLPKDVPDYIFDLASELQGEAAFDFNKQILDWAEFTNRDIMELILSIMHDTNKEKVPTNIANWLKMTPGGKQVLEDLEKPGKIECKQRVCKKIFEMEIEIKQFITDIKKREINFLSPKLLQFIMDEPNLDTYVANIYNTYGISKSDVSPSTIDVILRIMSDSKSPKDIPNYIFDLASELQGEAAFDFNKRILDWAKLNNKDIMELILNIMHNTNKEEVPEVITDWLKTTPEGKRILEDLEKPGKIECKQGVCKKIFEMEIEIKQFITDIKNEEINFLSPKLLQFIMDEPNLDTYVENIYNTYGISKSDVSPSTIDIILRIMSDSKFPKDIPNYIFDLAPELQGEAAFDFNKRILDWAKHNNKDIMELILNIMYNTDRKEVPEVIADWLKTTPGGEQILEELAKPGRIECKQGICKKIVEMEIEIKQFITDIENREINFLSPKLLQFIMNEQNLDTYVENIYNTYGISKSDVSPSTIDIILRIMSDTKFPRDIPNYIFDLASELQGEAAFDFNKRLLDWAKLNNKDIMELILNIMHNTNREEVPEVIADWLKTTPGGKQILEDLAKPGKIECEHGVCKKIFEFEIPGNAPEKIKKELLEFVLHLNEGQLDEISPQLLQFTIKQPEELKSIIRIIFELKGIPETEINPQKVVKLLILLMNKRNHVEIKTVDTSLIELILKLRGAQELSNFVLNWVNKYKTQDMLELFLKVVKENGGSAIPKNLLEWLLKLPNGKQIIDYLQMPGEITCKRHANKVKCVKVVYN